MRTKFDDASEGTFAVVNGAGIRAERSQHQRQAIRQILVVVDDQDPMLILRRTRRARFHG
jgi:hypothetical protein